MADQIVVMNQGRIEQAGEPADLYESPATAFVASFLGVSNLLGGSVAGPDRVVLETGEEIRVAPGTLHDRTGKVAIGIRPEKIRVGAGEDNELSGTVAESAYIGVSTQYIVDTPAGSLTVYVQNERPGTGGHQPGAPITLSWSPDSTFVVDLPEDRA